MKYIIVFFSIFLIFNSNCICQSYNDEKVSLGNFLKRMYTETPFEGVKIVDDYSKLYLISVFSLDSSQYPNKSDMFRVAQVKAQSQASRFLNGTSITAEVIITTSETKTNDSTVIITTEIIEKIKENTMGFVKGIELLINFPIDEGKRMVFIYYKELENDMND